MACICRLVKEQRQTVAFLSVGSFKLRLLRHPLTVDLSQSHKLPAARPEPF